MFLSGPMSNQIIGKNWLVSPLEVADKKKKVRKASHNTTVRCFLSWGRGSVKTAMVGKRGWE